MEAFGIHIRRLSERAHVAGQKEVERLELLAVGSALIQCGQRSQNSRTADRHSSDGWPLLKRQGPCLQSQRTTNDVEPDLGNPSAIIAVQVCGITQVSKTMLRPLRQRRVAFRIANKQ